MHRSNLTGIMSFVLSTSVATLCHACACGCGVFDVATSSMFPDGAGLTLYTQYDYQNQNINWSGQHRSPAQDNDDQKLRSSFYTLGAQYMLNRDWGVQVELPVVHRYFERTADGGGLVSSDWTSLGDLRLQGIYTGFSEDQSIGINFGVKLPTGEFKHDPDVVDRDTQVGSGSTDALLGGFFRHELLSDPWIDWFAQVQLDAPILTQDGYRPGVECDQALGVYLNGLRFKKLGISPVVQVIASERGHDSGPNAAHPVASGYERILLAPGVEFHLHPVMVYADVELPVYQHVTGEQLTSSFMCKIIFAYQF